MWVNGGLMVICLAIAYAFSSTSVEPTKISMEEALHKEKILIALISKDGVPTQDHTLKIINTSTEDLHLSLKAGTIINCPNSAEIAVSFSTDLSILVRARTQVYEQIHITCEVSYDKIPQKRRSGGLYSVYCKL